MASENSFIGQSLKMFFGILTTVLTTAILVYLGFQKKPEAESPVPVRVYEPSSVAYNPVTPVVPIPVPPPISISGTWYDGDDNTPAVLTEDGDNVTLSMKGIFNGVAIEITGTGIRRRLTVPMTFTVAMLGIPVSTCPGKFILEDENHATLTYQMNGMSMSSTLRR